MKNSLILTAALITCSIHTQAQVLSQANPIAKTFQVSQFGLPVDQVYVFCNTPQCPERSMKHLASAPVAVSRVAPPPVLMAQGSLGAAPVAQVSVAPVKPLLVKKTVKRRLTPKAEIECKPAAKK